MECFPNHDSTRHCTGPSSLHTTLDELSFKNDTGRVNFDFAYEVGRVLHPGLT